MKFVHVADTHIGLSLYKFKEFRMECFLNFVETLKYAIQEEDVEFVVHAGDLFNNNHPRPDSISLAKNWFDALGSAGKEIYIVDGNHDTFSDYTYMS